MTGLINSFKKFLGNKNTVTILGVIIGIAILLFFYNKRVNEATTPTKVPYAVREILATEEIKEEDIKWTEVNSAFLKNADIILSKEALVGKYISTGTSIPAGGAFYKNQVVEKSQLPNTIFDEIADGYTIYALSVNNHTTYGNTMHPGTSIDLYMKAIDENGKIMFGKLIEGIEILAVRDSGGKDVFNEEGAVGTPAELMFAVPDDMYELFMKASYLNGITIVPVPRNANYQPGEVKTKEYLKQFILAQCAEIPVE